MLLELPEFDWVAAKSVEETCALLAQYGEDTVALAGGTDLFTRMKHRRAVPRRLIDIKRIPGLDTIRYDESAGLSIGALATVQAIESSALVAGKYPSLRQAAAALGTLQIRNTATLGGNLANASPSAEFAPPLLTLGASVRCVSAAGTRQVPLEEFFLGPGKTVLSKAELLTEVLVPVQPAGARGIYLKHSLRKMDVAVVNAALLITVEGDEVSRPRGGGAAGLVCTEARIALGAVAPVPFRARRAEAVLKGQRLERELIDEAARLAAEASVPIDDFRAYADYRKKLVSMLVGKGLERLAARKA